MGNNLNPSRPMCEVEHYLLNLRVEDEVDSNNNSPSILRDPFD